MNTWPEKNLMTMTSDVKMLLRLRPNRRFAACTLPLVVLGLRLMSSLSELDETSTLWLLRLMAASIGFYYVKS